jgi:WD40 repeat protein
METKNISSEKKFVSFPLKKETKIDMQRQRAMVKVIIKLNSENMKGHIAVGSYGAVISIWYPEKKILVNAWRAKGAIYDLIELDNGDLVACANGNNFKNYISIYRYSDDEDKYESFKDIKIEEGSMLTALVKLEKNKFILATMDNSISFWSEKDGSYIKEKEVALKEVEKYDCIYSFIKLSNGNFMATGLSKVKLIGASSLECEKNEDFGEPSCILENSRKNVWVGNSPGCIVVFDLELKKLKEIEAHKMQVNKFLEYNGVMISASTDFNMKFWEPTTFDLLQTVQGYGEMTAICLFNENCLITAQGIPQVDFDEELRDYDEEDLLQFLVFYESE